MNENNPDNGNILIYQSEDGLTHIDVRMENETIWLTQQQMAELFQTSRTNVVEHIQHIYEEGELTIEATCRNFRQVQREGSRMVTPSNRQSYGRIQKMAEQHPFSRRRGLLGNYQIS